MTVAFATECSLPRWLASVKLGIAFDGVPARSGAISCSGAPYSSVAAALLRTRQAKKRIRLDYI